MKLITSDKIEFEGSIDQRKQEFYNVAGVKITVTFLDHDVWDFHCTCKHHSVKDVERQTQCIFTRSLDAYLKLKKVRR